MAEFQEVMRQYDRMCSHFEECADCPFHKNVIWCIKKIGGKRYVNENAKSAEKLIMDWAAEHPEPVYPTWYEVMAKFGVIDGLLGDKTLGEHVVDMLIKKRISADLAQKLGIEPKGES